MYYKSVNRGLSFTKPGVYTFCLVLFVGLSAVATGVNGLFVFLSVGLGGFIISGLLSERAMKSCTVTSIAATMVDAETPFEVSFSIENRSTWFTVYSMRAMFMLEPPKFRLISREVPSVASLRMSQVLPYSAQSYVAQARGMPRGEYRELLAMQLTSFPFGILEKFKLSPVPASLIVAPAVDQAFLEEARAELRRRFRADEVDREFFAHRPYMARDSLRHIDWRKSAAKPPRDWVVKLYRAPAGVMPVRVDAPWSLVAARPSEAAYEGYLSRIRTVLKALDEAQRAYVLDLGDRGAFAGHDLALAALAGLPRFKDRHATARISASALAVERSVSLRVLASGLAWDEPARRSSGAS